MADTKKIRWSFCPNDPKKTGTEEAIDAEQAAWLIQCGNAVEVGSQQDKDIEAARVIGRQIAAQGDTTTVVTDLPEEQAPAAAHRKRAE